MKPPKFLTDGYERFRAGGMSEKVKDLAAGQAPSVMVIACSDSRVHPATIFDADPGEIFMVRNVANIVPPCQIGSGYHGTSAALEFAVNSLKIKHILVLGHSGCGGVAASFVKAEDHPVGDFIGPWVGIIDEIRDAVCEAHQDASGEALQTHLEIANVHHSLENLLTFPFIRDAVDAGTLTLLGAWFDIEKAELEWVELPLTA